MQKLFDCITFFRENFITNIRLEIIGNEVDFFVICESKYDHKGKKKNLNFRLQNKKFKKKNNLPGNRQAFQYFQQPMGKSSRAARAYIKWT